MALSPGSLVVVMTAAVIGLAHCAPASAQAFEVLATVRTNNRTESLIFRVPAHRAHVSELRIRSGSLPVAIAGIEIEYADGKTERALMQDMLPPGHQSRPIPVDPRRAVARIFVTKRPGLRPGETTVQILGKVERRVPQP